MPVRPQMIDALPDSVSQRLVEEFPAGLHLGQLVLHYQPVVRLPMGGIIGAEALVRWDHPELGLLGPGIFVPAAEKNGLGGMLARWVLAQALDQVGQWQRDGFDLRVSLNVAPKDLRERDLRRFFATAMRIARVDPDRVQIELDSAAVRCTPGNLHAEIEELAALGVQVALDDFGTAFVGPELLQQLPVREIKLAAFLLHELRVDPSTADTIRGIAEYAHAHDLRVVAKGVEGQELLARLAELGCDAAQGACLSWPVPAQVFRTLLPRRLAGVA